jgi:hypothetical protein
VGWWLLLMAALTGCARRHEPRVVGIAMVPCLVDIGPVHSATDTLPGAPRFTVRGELRTPREGPALGNVRVAVGGHGLVAVSGRTFTIDSIRRGRYGIIVTADGYQQRVDRLIVPVPADSVIVVSLIPAGPGYVCGGWTEIADPAPPPWWQFWRRP